MENFPSLLEINMNIFKELKSVFVSASSFLIKTKKNTRIRRGNKYLIKTDRKKTVSVCILYCNNFELPSNLTEVDGIGHLKCVIIPHFPFL